jgi:RNA polymerase sigma-70 factor (ECF subfamily)
MNKGQADNDLISRFRTGDREALKEIYLSHYDAIFLFANRIVRNVEEANDITSDTFIKLWKQHAGFKNLPNIKAFLYLTCRNACFDHLRSRQRHNASHREIRYLSREGELWSDRELIEMEVLREIRLQVERLPPKCREVFKLIFFKRKKTREVAEQLGVSLATVQEHKSIAIKKLRNALLRKELLSLGNS